MDFSNTDPEQMFDDLKQIATDKGLDYIYPASPVTDETAESMQETAAAGCHYFRDGQPSCIFGHYLAKHGVTNVAEGQSASSVLGIGLKHGVTGEPVAQRRRRLALAVNSVQGAQDKGWTWGDALGLFHEVMETGLTPYIDNRRKVTDGE